MQYTMFNYATRWQVTKVTCSTQCLTMQHVGKLLKLHAVHNV